MQALRGGGAMVVMVNHPNSTWGDFDMSRGVRHWTRAQDITVALDNLLEDPSFGPLVDPSRIMAAGFSYGGWTALSLGGMTGNLAGLVDACTVHRDRMEACEMLLSDGVGLQQQDPQAWNTDYSDARITSVVAIDPGFVWGLEAGNTASLLPDAVLISLGDETRMMATDFDESGLTGLLPDTRAVRLAPAFHFTAMPLCTETGPDILAEEKDDPVCTDPDGTDRKAVHDEIVGIIAGMLGL
ncbi:hypothetical protein GQ651_08340 [Alphaproteobacteria bacterium GH1-50]|uniref:Peptidase S9 prolyl oligopeptidase catalytic domain-containing protein n=1 Tax=Kangsaoukella pontilimi TaxID=2691042 RepID=A0A7C9MWS0_9RHOB|nr:hypothetical protein [Kangsaoukella pontilimi]MXQ07854.1 hypothetical protein [Kangsaoukella pontilimi]